MSPKVALIICIMFVLWLLRFERNQSKNVSFALWIPVIWIFYIATKPLAIWFGLPGDGEGSPTDRNFGIVLLCICLFILFIRKQSLSKIIKENIWLILFIGLMLVSIVWSNMPYISFKRWIRELTAVLMAFIIATEREPNQAIESIFRRTLYVLIPFSVLLIKYFPDLGLFYVHHEGFQMWTGVTMHKNALGRLCLICMFFLIWSFIRRWRGHSVSVNRYQTMAEVFIFLLILWLLNGGETSSSATAIYSLTAGIIMLMILLWMKKSQIKIGLPPLMFIVAFIIGFGIATVIAGGSTMSQFTSTLGRSETLTGRTDIWAAILPIAMQSPILGHGFGGFWTPEVSEKIFQISESHNGYLEIILELGFVGILFFSIFILSCCQKAIKELDHDFDFGVLFICFIVMISLYNITEASINTFTSHLMAILLFLSVRPSVASSHLSENIDNSDVLQYKNLNNSEK